MTQAVRYKPGLTLIGLERKIWATEALELTLSAIAVDAEEDTIGIFDDGGVALRSLRLFLDPGGNLEPPAGSTLLCRGSAMISGIEQKVAAFRKA